MVALGGDACWIRVIARYGSALPGTRKGAATGVYNTTQSIGLALGGILGGWLLKIDGPSTVFLAASALVLCWLIVAVGMKLPPRRA